MRAGSTCRSTGEPGPLRQGDLDGNQLQDYRIRAGELNRFVEEWQARLAPLRRACGFEIAGAWTIPGEDRFVWLLTHLAGWDAFDEADAEYYASPGRAALDPDPARLIEGQRNARLAHVELP